jgi:glutaredoxin
MFCGRVKEFLSQKRVTLTERDVSQDEEALAELETFGVLATPVTVIDDEIVIDFDRAKLERLLAS